MAHREVEELYQAVMLKVAARMSNKFAGIPNGEQLRQKMLQVRENQVFTSGH